MARQRCLTRSSWRFTGIVQGPVNGQANPTTISFVIVFIAVFPHLTVLRFPEGKDHLYEVTRRWSEKGVGIREHLQVLKDNEPDTWLSENWNTVVEELIPLGVSQLFFFDAEQIRFLAEDDTSNEALSTAIKSLLGLDLAERLIADG